MLDLDRDSGTGISGRSASLLMSLVVAPYEIESGYDVYELSTFKLTRTLSDGERNTKKKLVMPLNDVYARHFMWGSTIWITVVQLTRHTEVQEIPAFPL